MSMCDVSGNRRFIFRSEETKSPNEMNYKCISTDHTKLCNIYIIKLHGGQCLLGLIFFLDEEKQICKVLYHNNLCDLCRSSTGLKFFSPPKKINVQFITRHKTLLNEFLTPFEVEILNVNYKEMLKILQEQTTTTNELTTDNADKYVIINKNNPNKLEIINNCYLCKLDSAANNKSSDRCTYCIFNNFSTIVTRWHVIDLCKIIDYIFVKCVDM